MEPQMVEKHYIGFRRAFPSLKDEDFEALFAAGFATPGSVKTATDVTLKTVLTTKQVSNLRKDSEGK